MLLAKPLFLVMLSLLPFGAMAETIPATVTPGLWLCEGGNDTVYTSGYLTELEACTAWGPTYGAGYYSQPGSHWSGNCLLYLSGRGLMGGCYTQSYSAYSCPATGGWTLSGTSCNRPNCLNWQVRQTDGTCANPYCGGCAEFNTSSHLCENTCFAPNQCITVEGATQCATSDGTCRLK